MVDLWDDRADAPRPPSMAGAFDRASSDRRTQAWIRKLFGTDPQDGASYRAMRIENSRRFVRSLHRHSRPTRVG